MAQTPKQGASLSAAPSPGQQYDPVAEARYRSLIEADLQRINARIQQGAGLQADEDETIIGSWTFDPGPVVIGTDPGGGDILRVGGSARIEGVLDIGSLWDIEAQDAAGVGRLLLRGGGANDESELFLAPTGSAVASRVTVSNAASLQNFFGLDIEVNGSFARLQAEAQGTGTLLPLKFVMGSTDAITIDTGGDVIIGTDPGGSELLRIGGALRVEDDVGDGSTAEHVISGGAGGVRLKLEADSNNSNENDVPSIEFSQDGDAVRWLIGGEAGNAFRIRSADQTTTRLEIERNGPMRLLGDGVIIGSDPGGSELLRVGGLIRIDDGSTNSATVPGVVVSTSDPSGDYPEGTIWCKV